MLAFGRGLAFSKQFDLTEDEIAFLGNHGPIIFVSQSQYPPFEAVQKDGSLDGMCIETVRWIATELGLKVEFRHMPFEKAQETVLSGNADVLTSLFYSDNRAERFAFSEPLFDVPASIFVKSDRPDISRIEDLRGRRVAIQRGDFAKDFLESIGIPFEYVPTENFGQATDAVIAGLADALIGDEQIVLHYLYNNNLTNWAKKVGSPLYVGKNCMAMRAGNEPLISIIAKGVAHARKGGVFQSISSKWLGASPFSPERGLGRYVPHLMGGLAVLALTVFVVFVINRKLRFLVWEKTHEQAAILDASLMGIAKMRDRIIIWANPSMYSIFGYHPPEMVQMSTLALYPSRNDYDQFGAQAYPVLANGMPYHAELLMCRRDGRQAWISLQGKALDHNWPHGESVWMFQDITARKTADEALKESEEKYRFLIESANDAVMIHTKLENGVPGPFFLVNQNACNMFGYSREDFMQLTPQELNAPEHLDHIPQIMDSLLKEGSIVFETIMVRKDGSRVPVEISTKLLQIHKSPFIFSLVRDISDRRKAEIILRENEANFRAFFESMTDIIWVCSPEGTIIETNHAASKNLGYSCEELKGMSVLDVHPVDKREEANAIFLEMFIGQRNECPLPLARKDGSLFPTETRIWFSRWRSADCLFGISKDLTAEVEAKQRFERLFRYNPAPLVVSSVNERRFVDVNEAFVKVTGYSREDVLGRTSHELSLFSNEPRQVKVADDLECMGRVSDTELAIRCKDGSIRHGLFSGEVITNQGREYLLTVMIDITERKQAEEAVSRLEKTHRELIELAPIGIFTSLPEGRYLTANPRLAEIYGYESPANLIEEVHDISRQIYFDYSDSVELRKLMEQGEIHQLEVRHRRKDGTVIWVSLSMREVRNENGVLLHYEGFVHNITGRKLAEEALHQASAYNRSLIEASLDPLVTIGPDGKITDVNAATESATSRNRQDLIGTDFSNYFMVPDKARQAYQEAFDKGFVRDYPLELRVGNGGSMPVVYNASVYRTPSGGVAGVFAAARDVSEIRRLERIKDDIERISKHDLKTPLFGIIQIPQIVIQETLLSEEHNNLLSLVSQAGRKMLNQINSTLELYKIETGAYSFHPKQCDVVESIRGCAQIICYGMRRALDSVRVVTPSINTDQKHVILTDPALFDIILMNILQNAIEASGPEDFVTVNLAYDDNYLVLAIHNILPVHKEIRKQFFDKYTTHGKKTGTGLGTYSAHIMTMAIGGRITMETSETTGTTVTVRLPLNPEGQSTYASHHD